MCVYLWVCLFFLSLNFAVASTKKCFRCGDKDMVFQMAFLQYHSFQVLFTSLCNVCASVCVCMFFFLLFDICFSCVCTRVFVCLSMKSTFSCLCECVLYFDGLLEIFVYAIFYSLPFQCENFTIAINILLVWKRPSK